MKDPFPSLIFCGKCGAVSEGVDFCPYDEEIAEEKNECNCCPKCIYECTLEI